MCYRITLVLGIVFAVALTFTGVVVSQQAVETAATAQSDALRQLSVGLAGEYLKLAESDLQLVKTEREQFPGNVPDADVASLELTVAIAKDRVQAARVPAGKSVLAAFRPSTELAVKLYDDQLARLKNSNLRQPGSVPAYMIARFESKSQIAKLNSEMLKALENRPPAEQLQWQLEQLANRTEDLNSRLRVLETIRK